MRRYLTVRIEVRINLAACLWVALLAVRLFM